MEKEKKDCSRGGFCFCKALLAILIIVLIWVDPSWSKIAITILAALILIGAGCCWCKKKKLNEQPK